MHLKHKLISVKPDSGPQLSRTQHLVPSNFKLQTRLSSTGTIQMMSPNDGLSVGPSVNGPIGYLGSKIRFLTSNLTSRRVILLEVRLVI